MLTPEGQMQLGETLGFMNIHRLDRPQMQYRLHLANEEDCVLARRLARMASRGRGAPNFVQLLINGQGPVHVS